MKNLRRSLFTFVLFTFSASRLFAQSAAELDADPGALPPKTAPTATSPATKPAPNAQPEAIRERRFQVNFEKSLGLAPAMEIIRQELPDLNIVVPPSLSEIPIGQLKLHNVTIEGLVLAIPAATDGQIQGMYDGNSYLTFSSNFERPQQQSVCRVLSLRSYLKDKDEKEVDRAIEDLKQVVHMACEHLAIARKALPVKAPQFSVHPSTKLLIVVGSPESVAIVEEVVVAVTEGTDASIASGLDGVAPGAMPGTGKGGGAFGGGFGGNRNFAPSPKKVAPQINPKGAPEIPGLPGQKF